MKPKHRLLVWLASIFVLGALGVSLAQGPAPQGVGLIRNDAGAFAGYTLVSPLQSKSTFLIDGNGRVVKAWDPDSTLASIAYLWEKGDLMGGGLAPNPPFGTTAGGGGKMQEFNWRGDLVGAFAYGTATATQHHDF